MQYPKRVSPSALVGMPGYKFNVIHIPDRFNQTVTEYIQPIEICKDIGYSTEVESVWMTVLSCLGPQLELPIISLFYLA